jgi:isoleucyl-tRNA synthetase
MSKSHPLKLSTKPGPVDFAALEEKVLAYWDKVNAFERSINERPEDKPYVFYDGPPFATGLPHHGHLLSSTTKDVVPRYWTMKGYRVERVWGWDCHGLPIENIVEKQLKIKGGKKGIEQLGIDKFNAACRNAIFTYDKEWQKIIRRLGRWVDMDQSYKTMDLSYMESIWWAFKTLYEKGLVYEGKKVILYCPRCSTPLSNFEIAMDNSYQQVHEESTTYKFPVKNQKDTYLLAWSTTPWNKLATPALAVNPKLTYVKVKQNGEYYILAKDTLSHLKDSPHEIVQEFKGADVVKLEFDMLFDFYPERGGKQAGVIIADDFVTAVEGTGIVTLAVYGEDDYRVMLEHDIQLIEHVDDGGKLKPDVKPWAGMDILEANPLIDEELLGRNLIYQHTPHVHSVATCYRCSTRLYYAPLPAWFIDIQKLKPKLISTNQKINWYPLHLKKGRFGKGLETAPDWNISRSRYWGTPMPIWKGDKTGNIKVIGSIAELKLWAVDPREVKNITDLHRESIDHIKVWVDDDKTEPGTKIPEVFDCWVESGSMPFASEGYPVKNKQRFESRHPAQFIAEYIAQTRAWFYTLHVMSVALFDTHTFENAVATGTYMAADGQKLSKSKRNFTDPMELIDKYGVDSLRLFMMSSSVMKGESVNFLDSGVAEIRRKVLNIFYNVLKFYLLFDDGVGDYGFSKNPQHVMDKWLISLTQNLTQTYLKAMDNYDIVTATRSVMAYVSDLSTWYLRRSRSRLRAGDKEGLRVFRTALKLWALLLAPIAPFFAETLYQNLPGDKLDSVHLEMLPLVDNLLIDNQLEEQMTEARKAVEKAHALRKDNGLKVRQPLSSATITSTLKAPKPNLLEVIAKEINVKQVNWNQGKELEVSLDTQLTPELESEGEAREIIRSIQNARKKAGTSLNETVVVELPSWPKDFESEIKQKVVASDLRVGNTLKVIRS